MVLKIFTVYDSKLEAYMQPFFAQTKGQALRMWQDTVADEKSQFNKHAADYTLFQIGEFDDATAQFINEKQLINLGNAVEFKNTQKHMEL